MPEQAGEQSGAECKCIHEQDIHRLLKSLLDGNGELPLIRRFDMTERTVEELAIIINGTDNMPGLRTHWIETNASFNTIKKMLTAGMALGTLIALGFGIYFGYQNLHHRPIGENHLPGVSSTQNPPPTDAGLPTQYDPSRR